MPVQIQTIKEFQEGFDKVFTPWNADDESHAFLEKLFDKKDVQTKGVQLLKGTSEEELQHVARILKLPQTIKEHKYKNLIQAFEKTYPGTVFSIVRSVALLEKITK